MSVKAKPYILLLILLAVVYWPLGVYQIQFDFLDCWLPWRHFLSKSYHNGIFPLWNPFQQLGYPIHADLQGPALSYENFITGNLFSINLTTLQLIVFSYLYLATAGMYKLGKHLFRHHQTSLSIALAYACSGMFIHHLQHFFSIISFACFPLTFYFLLQLLNKKKWKYVFALVPILVLQVTTGNQTFNIINFQLFLGIALVHLYHDYKAGYSEGLKISLKQIFVLGIILALAVSPTLISYMQTKDSVDRYQGLAYEKMTGNSLSWESLFGWINPFITTQSNQFLKTDPSMTGIFIGFFLLSASIGFFIFSKHRYKTVFLALLLLSILLALGKNTSFHYYFIKINPLLGLFRFPAYFMFYATIILLFASGFFLKDIFEQRIKFNRLVYVFSGIAMLHLVLIIAYGADKGSFVYHLRNGDFFTAFHTLTFSQTLFLSTLFILPLLLSSFLLLAKKEWVNKFGTIILLEIVVISSLNLFSVLSDRKAKAMDSFIAALPKTFALADTNAVDDNSYIHHYPEGIWRNKEQFLNVVSSEFFNSFYLKEINSLLDTKGKLKGDHNVFQAKNALIKLEEFIPGKISFTANAPQNEKLTILQMDSPYWLVKCDNVEQSKEKNILVNVELKKGIHHYQLIYHNPMVVYTFWISYSLVFISLLLAGFLHFHGTSRLAYSAVIGCIFLSPVLFFIF